MKLSARILAVALVLILAVGAVSAQANWKPNKPITIIVPWGAGGSTDQVTRVCAAELEAALGTKIVIVNQPGASGSVGTKNALDAPKDGYTWTAGAAADLATYKVQGMLDTDIRKDWHVFLSVANVSVVGVNAMTPYKDFSELLAAFKSKPGQITVATAGQSSAGHIGIELIRKYTGIEYKHVTYDGGNPAVIACVSGETEMTTQLAVEQADMIRGKKIRPLAVMSDKPLNLEGFGEIPPITKWVKDFKTGPNYFGIFIPVGVPKNVVDTVEKAWKNVIMKSTKVQEYAKSRGAMFAPSFGKEAQDRAFSYYQPVAWLYWDAGKAKVSPDTVGIPKP
ncbi:MAG TPA: tripartite tricarboxylate transporter substrate binding protein [Spirochaetales bacterium]|nr:tripartite tricarboxylate transporter substrate binding protein [Spirochaetales bacterium]